jgi:hypothetical protein
MYKFEGRVLRAAPYVLNGSTTFVFDIRVEASDDAVIPRGEVVRVNIHSAYVEGRSQMAALAVLKRGDFVWLACDADVQRPRDADEVFVQVDHLRTLQATYVD